MNLSFKIQLTAFLLFSTPFAADAQSLRDYTYVPFPEEIGHKWLIDRLDPWYRSSHLETITVVGDSIVFGRRYIKLSDGNLYRNDTSAKALYGIPKGTIQDTLIMTFNLSVGDRVPKSFITCTSPLDRGCSDMLQNPMLDSYVANVDTVLIGSEYHRRLHCRGYINRFKGFLIEGIGHGRGFFDKITPFDGIRDTLNLLICYDDRVVDPSDRNFCGPLSAQAIQIYNQILVLNNPVHSESLHIKILNTRFRSACIQLISLIGNVAYLRNINNDSQDQEIKIDNLAAGVYSLRLISKEFAGQPIAVVVK